MCYFYIKTLCAILSIVYILCASSVHTTEIEADDQPKKYALLVGGGVSKKDTFESFYANIEYVSNVLKQMGYQDENVKILFFGGNTPIHPIVEGDATKYRFITELLLLENEIDSNDSLVIFRSGHGIIDLVLKKHEPSPSIKHVSIDDKFEIIETTAVMIFPDGVLTCLELQERLARIKAKQIVVILNQCFSGKFTDMALKLNNTVIISQTDLALNQTRKTLRWKHDEWPFVKCFFDGFFNNGKEEKKQSVYKAFQYMRQCNPNIEGIPVKADLPLLKENPKIKYGKSLEIGTVYID